MTRPVVAFDAYEIVPGSGRSIGIQNYSFRLLQAMARSVPADVDLLVLANSANAAQVRAAVGAAPRVSVAVLGGPPGKLRRQLWQYGLAGLELRRRGAAGYFSPRGYLPYGLPAGTRSVVVCHDLIRLWYSRHAPGYFSWLEHRILCAGLVRSVRQADHVVAISQATAQDIAAYVPGAAPVSVVHNGIPMVASTRRERVGPYLFAVTSTLPHKNSAGLLAGYAAYRRLSAAPLPLVVCGLDGVDAPGVSCVRGISDETLHNLYAHAEGFVTCSFIEGFGFPPLEALLHGVPSLCSDIPAHREVTMGSALFADPHDPAAIGQGLSDLVALRRRLLPGLADKVRATFSWTRCADGVWAVIERSRRG